MYHSFFNTNCNWFLFLHVQDLYLLQMVQVEERGLTCITSPYRMFSELRCCLCLPLGPPHTDNSLSWGAVWAYLCGLPIQTVLWVEVLFDQVFLLLPLLDGCFKGLGRLLEGTCCTHQVIGRLSQPLAGLFQLSLRGLKQVVNLKILT